MRALNSGLDTQRTKAETGRVRGSDNKPKNISGHAWAKHQRLNAQLLKRGGRRRKSTWNMTSSASQTTNEN